MERIPSLSSVVDTQSEENSQNQASTLIKRESRTRSVGFSRKVDCQVCEDRPYSFCHVLQGKKEIVELNTIANALTVPAGRILMEEGEEAVNYYSISHGTVKLFKLMPDGRRHIIGFAGKGYFMGLTNDGKYSYSAEVLEETRLCRFSHSKLEHMFDLYPQLRREILKEAINVLAFSQDQMLLLGRKTSQEKVASFLVIHRKMEDSSVISLPMTRLDIADYLGLTMETVSRTFGWLKKQKLISFIDSHHVKIENGTALYNLAIGNC